MLGEVGPGPMNRDATISDKSMKDYLVRAAPGVVTLFNYERGNLSHDLLAGLSVAAVALPVGAAYVQLAGFNPASSE